MEPKITNDLKKASEQLKKKMLDVQKLSKELLAYRDKFVAEKNADKKEKMKSTLIKLTKEKKALEDEVKKLERKFDDMVTSEPDDDVYTESVLREAVRSYIKKYLKK
jgi:predicted nuclease with TOPRIM domain